MGEREYGCRETVKHTQRRMTDETKDMERMMFNLHAVSLEVDQRPWEGQYPDTCSSRDRKEIQGKVKGHTGAVLINGFALLCRVNPKKSRCRLKVIFFKVKVKVDELH